MSVPVRTSVVAIVGNPRPNSRTAAAAGAAADRVAGYLRSGPPRLIDLATRETPLGPDASHRLADELADVSSAAALVVASPTYKASFTGLLKSFLDLLAPQSLLGTVAFPLMTLGDPAHTLAADVHLRPVLQELGASLPAPSLVLTDHALANLDVTLDAWWATAEPTLLGIGPVPSATHAF